jgi:hypothetical protein
MISSIKTTGEKFAAGTQIPGLDWGFESALR